MKKTIITILAAIGLNANANSPLQPATDPTPNPVVIQLSVGGGMPVPGGLVGRTISVHADGEARVEERRYGNPINTPMTNSESFLTQVGGQDMYLIGRAVEQLHGGELVKGNGPGCMDAPGYVYSVNKGYKWFKIYQKMNCVDQPLKDESQRAAALSIKNFLDQLDDLIK